LQHFGDITGDLLDGGGQRGVRPLAAAAYEHVDVSEEARKSDLLPTCAKTMQKIVGGG
jgi:hypothetical protein